MVMKKKKPPGPPKEEVDDVDVGCEVEVVRRSFMPGVLSTVPLCARQPFRAVVTGRRRPAAGGVTKTLGPKRIKASQMLQSKFLTTGKTDFLVTKKTKLLLEATAAESSSDSSDSDSSSDESEEPEFKPHEPLVLYEPTDEERRRGAKEVVVPPLLCQFLRPHQREGVQFTFECVYEMKDYDGCGAILADDMGLGKTLQSLTVLYAMLKNSDAKKCDQSKETSRRDSAIARRCVVVCPCSLVKNWQDEFEKWINSKAKEPKDRVECMAIAEAARKTVEAMIDQFLMPTSRYDVLVLSYETFRAQAARFVKKDKVAKGPHGCVDLLICDEAHRLKNADAQTSTALASLACRRRILLSGTPMQNDLIEFYSMVTFTNPGIFGSKEDFAKNFERPILRGREPDATDSQKHKGAERQKELSALADKFIIRRMNRLNARHLPPKLTQVVCCPLTDCQKTMYRYLIDERSRDAALEGSVKDSLGYVQLLQKVCNHPSIVVAGGASSSKGKQATRDAALRAMIPTKTTTTTKDAEATTQPKGRNGRVLARYSAAPSKTVVDPWLSGKMRVLYSLMKELYKARKERIVVISVFMTTLDLIESLCDAEGWPSCKLGGSTPAKKRKQFNDEFNDPKSGYFAFLLSSKAGGCGLNLIGGSRLVMFDMSWNPADDKQAAARCWRDGQKLQCYTYRFVSTGTLEERIFQRQLAKEGLQNVIEDKDQINHFATDDLKRLFFFRDDTASELHDELQCTECKGKHAAKKAIATTTGNNALSSAAASLCARALRDDIFTRDAATPFLQPYGGGGGGGKEDTKKKNNAAPPEEDSKTDKNCDDDDDDEKSPPPPPPPEEPTQQQQQQQQQQPQEEEEEPPLKSSSSSPKKSPSPEWRRWNEESVDPASVRALRRASAVESFECTTRLDGLEDNLNRHLNDRLWEVFQGIVREGRRVAREGHILDRKIEEERSARHVDAGAGFGDGARRRGGVSKATTGRREFPSFSQVARRKKQQQQFLQKQQSGGGVVVAAFGKSTTTTGTGGVTPQQNMGLDTRFYFGDTRSAGDDEPALHATPRGDVDVCEMSDEYFSRCLADYRQLAMDFVSRCGAPWYAIDSGVFNEVMLQCDLAAAFRYHEINVTLAEVDALWREIVDDARKLNAPDVGPLKKLGIKPRREGGRRGEHSKKKHTHHDDRPRGGQGGEHDKDDDEPPQAEAEAGVSVRESSHAVVPALSDDQKDDGPRGDKGEGDPTGKKGRKQKVLTVAESLAVALNHPDVRYNVLTVADFLEWQKRRHPLLHPRLQERSPDDIDKLYLMGRVVPKDVFCAHFDFFTPMLDKLHVIRLLNVVVGDGRPLVMRMNEACVEHCDQPCRCQYLLDDDSPSSSGCTTWFF